MTIGLSKMHDQALTARWLGRLLELLTDLEARLARGESVYVHCWGGRGRAGLVAACFLQHAYGISGEEALQRIGRAYDTRGDTGVPAVLYCCNKWQELQLIPCQSPHLLYLGFLCSQVTDHRRRNNSGSWCETLLRARAANDLRQQICIGI